MKKHLAVLALILAALPNLYSGHYGYLLGYPTGYSVTPLFGRSGARFDEIVNFLPAACKGQSAKSCADLSKFSLFVTIKRELFESLNISTLAEQVQTMTARAERKGEKPGMAAPEKLGALAGWTFTNAAPKPGALDTTTILEGQQVLYLFQYQRDNQAMRPVLKSLVEVTPSEPAAGRP
jgi:hypothetical protein